jgi:hypothetical protein
VHICGKLGTLMHKKKLSERNMQLGNGCPVIADKGGCTCATINC